MTPSGFFSSWETVEISRVRLLVEAGQLGDQLPLAVVGPRVEDGPSEVVTHLKRRGALALGPARLPDAAGDQHHSQRLRAGADGGQHQCPGPAIGEVPGQVGPVVLVELLVAPHPARFRDHHRLLAPGPTRGVRGGDHQPAPQPDRGVGGEVGRRVGVDQHGEIVGAEAVGEELPGLGQELAVAEPPGGGPDHLLRRGGQPDLLTELLALDGRQHRPDRQPQVGVELTELYGTGPSARAGLVEVHECPQLSSVVQDAGDQDVQGAPLVRGAGVLDLRDPAVRRQLLHRLGGEPLLGDEGPLAVLRAEPERQRHGRERRRPAQHLVVGILVAGDRDELQHVVGPQHLDLAGPEARTLPGVVGDQAQRRASSVVAPAVVPGECGRRRLRLGHGGAPSGDRGPRVARASGHCRVFRTARARIEEPAAAHGLTARPASPCLSGHLSRPTMGS